MLGKRIRRNKARFSRVGQGVIEYAGALVVAASIIAASIFIVPPAFAGFMNSVYVSMTAYIAGQVPK